MQANTICYREISLDELQEHALEVDVSEKGHVVYYWQGDALVAVPETWKRPPWNEGTLADETWLGNLKLPGVRAWGAFEHEMMVGLIVYRPNLSAGMAQLAALFVSASHRQRGIAARLTAGLVRQAKSDGHARLYVSATPSQSAVGFYQSQGFDPTLEVHPDLYELEPEDIHMIKDL